MSDEKQPRMKAIGVEARTRLESLAPYMAFKTDDNLMSSVLISGSFDPKDDWANGIYENSRYFRFHITPHNKQRWYNDGEPVCVELIQGYNVPKFRKYTGPANKVLDKIEAWIRAAKG